VSKYLADLKPFCNGKAAEQQKALESFRKAVEDARSAMFALVDKFYFDIQ